MRLRSAVPALVFFAIGLSPAATAQDWRGGRARVEGTVVNEKGEPGEGCTVKMRWGRSSHGGPDLVTDKKGHFAIFGIGGGPWDVDFEAAGYKTKKVGVSLSETGRNAPVDVQLEPAPKAAPAPVVQQLVVGGKNVSREAADAIDAGNAAMGARNWTAARESYLKALSELPDYGPLLDRIAAAYLGEGNADEAIRYARQAAEKDPSDSTAWRMVAEIELERGNLEAGTAALDKVPPEKIKDPQPYLNVGILLYNRKKPSEAAAAFDKAIGIKPDFADAYYYRGLCRLQEKKNAEARADLTKALELAPDGPDARDIKDLLQTLR